MWMIALLACGPEAEDTDLTGGPQLSTGRDVIDFGAVYANTTETQNLRLTNSGDAPLTLGRASFLGGDSLFHASDVSGVVLQPGEDKGIQIQLDVPNIDAPLTTVLVLASDDPRGDVWVDLTASPQTYVTNVDPPDADFDTVGLGCRAVQTTILSVQGAAPAHVYALETDAPFTVDALEATNGPLPWTLWPGELATYEVSFVPDNLVQVVGTVRIFGDQGLLLAEQLVEGEGAEEIYRNDTFTVDSGDDTVFPLSLVPDPDTLDVTVNGLANDRWTWRASDNSLVFEYTFLGDEIAARYDVTISCL